MNNFLRIFIMKQKKGFTLIELLVVISIIALLLAILMPALGKARNLAMIATCSGQLRQWGVVCAQYTNENNNMFWQGWFGDPQPGNQNPAVKLWMCVTWKYYQNPDFLFCPAAKLPFTKENATRGTADTAWGGGKDGLTWCSMPKPGVKDKNGKMAMWNPKGSYGENSFVANKTGGNYTSDTQYWRSREIKGSNNVPMLGDSAWLDAWVGQDATPPPYKDADGISKDNMWRLCIDRHKGKVVWVFVDGSVRPVGLKELFTLLWSKNYKPEKNPFTWSYYGGTGGNPSNLWKSEAPWMTGFKEYMDK
jgi:prepilin-type N-terminal cleavage/methylation domain-containing protein/prepilin-type processing-associated H-X9-DG protein